MNSYPLVSVIMPAFNAENYIGKAIESIIFQSYTHWELIIINDGSSDNTQEIIEGYANSEKRIISLINSKNKGLVYTRNKGLRTAKGKYIANLDSDDVAKINRLMIQVQYMESHPKTVLLGASCELINHNNKIIGTEDRKIPSRFLKSLLLFSNYFINSTTIFKRDAANECKYLDSFPLAEDYHFFTQLLEHGDIANLDRVLIQYRIHNSNISQIKKHELNSTIGKIHKTLLNKLGLNVSEDNLKLHESLVSKDERIDFECLMNTRNWLEMLKSANDKSKTYMQEEFDYVCRIFYRRACLKTKQGFKAIAWYFSSSLSVSIWKDIHSNLTFFAKALLKKT